jgi:tetratricopeptide (TPR) repeat protein
MDGDHDTAAHALRRAVVRAPNDADVLAVAAWSAPGAAGIFTEANAWADRALALNPATPGWYLLAKGTAAFSAGDYAAAVEALQAAPPGFAERSFILAAAHAMLGDTAAARVVADDLRAMIPGFDLDRYLQTWAEPDLRRRLHDGAIRAGLGN